MIEITRGKIYPQKIKKIIFLHIIIDQGIIYIGKIIVPLFTTQRLRRPSSAMYNRGAIPFSCVVQFSTVTLGTAV